MRRSMNFNLSEDDWIKIKKWKSELPKQDNHGGAIGGRYGYEFIPTTLGTTKRVKDYISGEVLDLTDYEHW